MSAIEPAEANRVELIRDPHRSAKLHVLIDVSPLFELDGTPKVAGEALERQLTEWCSRAVLRFLENGRATVAGHP